MKRQRKMATDNNKQIKRRIRRAYVTSTVSIALVLFLLGSVGYLILNALNATDRLRESVTMHVMLREDVTDGQKTEIEKKISADQAILSSRFVPKEEAAEEFKKYIGKDFVEFLDYNPLPDSYEVKLASETSKAGKVGAVEKRLSAMPGVDEVVYQKNVVEQISSNINRFNLILLMFGGTLLVISLILLNNTIRITVLSKRYIINTMKLVGATKWFIMRPFLWQSVIQGFYAGVIAILMLLAMMTGLNQQLPEVSFIIDNRAVPLIFLSLVFGGILISLLFTGFAVNKFIKMNSNHIHVY